jgi:hypothetical protein
MTNDTSLATSRLITSSRARRCARSSSSSPKRGEAPLKAACVYDEQVVDVIA